MQTYRARGPIVGSRRVALIAIMTALALVGNYALVSIPNVELGSTILFFTSYAFGIEIALPAVLLMAIIYGNINPWGAFIPQIWLAQVIGWVYIVAVGQLLRPKTFGKGSISILLFIIAGAVSTLVFDLVTDIGYAIVFSIPYYVALIGGMPFMAVHVISNAILFSVAIPRLERGVILQFANEIYGQEESMELKTEE